MVEGARLESVYTATYRGFESLPLRHFQYPACLLFYIFAPIVERLKLESEEPRYGPSGRHKVREPR